MTFLKVCHSAVQIVFVVTDQFDPYTNCIMAGSRFDMSAEEVIEYCKE